MKPRPLRLLPLLLLLLLLLDPAVLAPRPVSAAPVKATFHHTVAFNPSNDPRANNDPFMSLSEREQEEKFSTDEGKPLAELFASLARFEDHVFVNVVLVGFDRDSTAELDVSATELNQYFQALIATEQSRHLARLDAPSAVWLQHIFSVTKAPRSLIASINTALADSLLKTAGLHSGNASLSREGVAVPFEAVTDLLRDYYNTAPMLRTAYTFFLINGRAPLESSGYVYFPHGSLHGEGDAAGDGNAAAGDGSGRCGGALWADPEYRFAWVDLGAGPVSYGPILEGEGTVLWNTIPRPIAVTEPAPFLAQLVALVWTSTRHLLTPPAAHAVNDAPMLEVRLFHMDATRSPSPYSAPSVTADSLLDSLTPLLLPGQAIDVSEIELRIAEWPLIGAALAAARKTRVAGSELRSFIDAASLYASVESELRALHNEEGAPVIPVFFFDVGDEILLFEGGARVVAFPHAILALRSPAQEVVPFACSDHTGPVALPPAELEREVLAALLQSLWGLAPTERGLRGGTDAVVSDYLWTAVNCPFGPFAAGVTGKTLSFATRDQIHRHAVHSLINGTLLELQGLLEHFSRFGRELGDVFSPIETTLFVRRWNVLRYKIDQAAIHLSVNKLGDALYYARSLRHDVEWVHGLVHSAGRRLHSHVVCAHDDEGIMAKAAPFGPLIGMWLLVLVDTWRRRPRRE